MANKVEQADVALARCGNEIEDMMAQRDCARLRLAALQTPCVWREEDDGWYMTACKNAFSGMAGTYCPGCGHPIEVIPMTIQKHCPHCGRGPRLRPGVASHHLPV